LMNWGLTNWGSTNCGWAIFSFYFYFIGEAWLQAHLYIIIRYIFLLFLFLFLLYTFPQGLIPYSLWYNCTQIRKWMHWQKVSNVLKPFWNWFLIHSFKIPLHIAHRNPRMNSADEKWSTWRFIYIHTCMCV
jgi:hypothetical protein